MFDRHTPNLGKIHSHVEVTAAIALLNRLHIELDTDGCFQHDQHRVCLRIERGVPYVLVDGTRLEWKVVAPLLKPRTLPRIPSRPTYRLNGDLVL